jgi:tetratricopeptide (TPR) repeat protein
MAAAVGARQIGDFETLVQALMAIDDAEHHLGLPLTGTHTREALQVCVENGMRWRESIARQNLGAIAYFGGHWDEAIEYFQTGRRVALEAGYALGAAEAEVNLGDLLVSVGEVDEAERVLIDAVRVLKAMRMDWFAAYGELQLARVTVAREQYSRAEHELSALVDRFVELGTRATALETKLVLVEAVSSTGDYQRALDLIGEGEQLVGDQAGPLLPRVLLQRAIALLGLGHLDECEEAVIAGLAKSHELKLPYEEALLLGVRQQLAARRGDAEGASSYALAAQGLLEGLGARS